MKPKNIQEYVVNCGYEYTDDIFIVPSNVYLRAIEFKQHVTKYPFNVIQHTQTSSSKYICWNYELKTIREITFDVFLTQMKFFSFLKEDNDFFDTIVKEILNQDLSEIASQSALIFNR